MGGGAGAPSLTAYDLSGLGSLQLGPAERTAVARLGRERFMRWARAGAKSTPAF